MVLMILAAQSFAQNIHNPRLAPVYRGLFGGALITDPPTEIETVNLFDMGISWDLNAECGKFDPQLSISNQLNGITDGFRNMMDNIISAATGAVSSLPALAIQRVHPGLYDLLMQGILQGKIDFEYAKLSCEDMANVMMGNQAFPFENYKLAIKTTNWSKEIAASGGDAVQAKSDMDDRDHGDEGIEWACGAFHGGAGQPPINALTDVAKAGYNILHERANVCDNADVPVDSSDMYKYWTGPTHAVDWVKDVLGETEIRLCDGCKKQRSRPGKGLSYMHADLKEALILRLENLVSGADTLTWQNLNRVSAPPAVKVDQAIILMIRKRQVEMQEQMIEKLADEIAMARLYEQTRYMIQIFRTGIKEPNISGDDEARKVVRNAVSDLQSELENLKRETEMKEDAAQRTIYYLLGSEEKDAQDSEGTRTRRPLGIGPLGAP
ncbi:integrating conjugative element protein [Zhongshania marina]|uniref:Integrating conjugative element protein n=2 Tax=Zhongshania marina TaxID=2304603 RepID=A0A2S4HC98_9GAMM|nr:integrating conjugative element protein [Marortus luteolus]